MPLRMSSAAHYASACAFESTTVSIVDDDLSTRDAMVQLLRSAGWKAKAFDSAEAFLTSGVDASHVVMIVDIQMPSMNGFEMREKLLSNGRAPPTIFITACIEHDTQQRAVACGAVALLTKPVDISELLMQLDHALHRRWP